MMKQRNLILPICLMISLVWGLILTSLTGCTGKTAAVIESSQTPDSASLTQGTTPSSGLAGTANQTLTPHASRLPVLTTPSGYFITVTYKNEVVAMITRADLENLPQVKVIAAGLAENGPTLLSLLAQAGITDFSSLTAYGMTRGRLASAELSLTRGQVDGNVVLDLNNRGKCKLCSDKVPQNDWIIDLERLEVN